jgi:hypothetical protein
MSQRDLYQKISNATGEPLAVIENLGFVELRRIAFEREHPTDTLDDCELNFEAELAVADLRGAAVAC